MSLSLSFAAFPVLPGPARSAATPKDGLRPRPAGARLVSGAAVSSQSFVRQPEAARGRLAVRTYRQEGAVA